MDIITFDDNEKIEKRDYSYIESSIKRYIERNNFPKKLVINEIKTDIEKREKLELQIKEKLEEMNKAMIKLKTDSSNLKKENTKKINQLLNQFSSVIF